MLNCRLDRIECDREGRQVVDQMKGRMKIRGCLAGDKSLLKRQARSRTAGGMVAGRGGGIVMTMMSVGGFRVTVR